MKLSPRRLTAVKSTRSVSSSKKSIVLYPLQGKVNFCGSTSQLDVHRVSEMMDRSDAAEPAFDNFARFDEGSVLLGSACHSTGASRSVSSLSTTLPRATQSFIDVFDPADGTSRTSAVRRCCFANGAEWLRFTAGFVCILMIIVTLRAGDHGSSSGTKPVPAGASAGSLPASPPSHRKTVAPPPVLSPTPSPTPVPDRTDLDAAMSAAYAAVANGANDTAVAITDLDAPE